MALPKNSWRPFRIDVFTSKTAVYKGLLYIDWRAAVGEGRTNDAGSWYLDARQHPSNDHAGRDNIAAHVSSPLRDSLPQNCDRPDSGGVSAPSHQHLPQHTPPPTPQDLSLEAGSSPLNTEILLRNNIGCFKKSFTISKEYINLYRGHTQRFELS
jgi:hypothetical protein